MLPIVERELRVQSRNAGLYRARIGASILATGAGALTLRTLFHSRNPASGGQGVFTVLLWLCFLTCLWEGFRKAAAVLAIEREEGTLGLLFLTDLKGYDVILGKLVAVSFRSIHGLLAFFPVLAITLLMGGVSLMQFTMSVLHLLATLFFSLSLSLWVSAGRREAAEAQRRTFALLFLILVIPLVLSWLPGINDARLQWLIQSAASLKITSVLTQPDFPWESVIGWPILCLVTGAILLVRASWILPSTWQSSVTQPQVSIRPADDERRRKIGHLLRKNPVLWLAFRERLSRSGTVIFGLVLISSLVPVIPWSGDDNGGLLLTYWILKLALLSLLMQVASTVSRQAHALKSLGSLELIIATPVNITMVIRGLETGFIHRFRYHFLALMGAAGLAIAMESLKNYSLSLMASIPFGNGLLVGGLMALSAFLDVLSVGYLAAYQGIKRDATAAFSRCVALLVFQTLPIYCIPNMVIDLIVIVACSSSLPKEIRLQAEGSSRYLPQTEPWWARLLGKLSPKVTAPRSETGR